MAFTGVAVVTRVTDVLARITGLSLLAGASGTISLLEGPGTVKLPDACNWAPYDGIDLTESVQFMIVKASSGAVAIPIRVVKSGAGGVPTTFVATLTNDDAQNPSPELEIYVRFH
jgi:hypothetical protein